jgi:hypothetical protein
VKRLARNLIVAIGIAALAAAIWFGASAIAVVTAR